MTDKIFFPFAAVYILFKYKSKRLFPKTDIFRTVTPGFYGTVTQKESLLKCRDGKFSSASCYWTVAQRAEVVLADFVFHRAVLAHAAHPELVLLDGQAGHDAHGQLPLRAKSQNTEDTQEVRKLDLLESILARH